MSEPKKYVKLPVVIDAIEWDGTVEGGGAIIAWMRRYGVVPTGEWTTEPDPATGSEVDVVSLYIPTLEGRMLANPGDFIVKGVKDEFYPVKPDIFAATYREMTE